MPALLDAVEMVLKVDDVVHSSKIDVIARFYEIRAIVDVAYRERGENHADGK